MPRRQIAATSGRQPRSRGARLVAQPPDLTDGSALSAAAMVAMHQECMAKIASLESRLDQPSWPTQEPAATVAQAALLQAPLVQTSPAGVLSTPSTSGMNSSIPQLAVAKDITGERSGPNQLDDHLSSVVRQKITDNAFVEFASLLPGRADHCEETRQGLVVSKDGVLTIGPKEPTGGKVLGYMAWTQAWYIYMTVHVRSCPSMAVALLKYGDTIRSLYQKGMDWARYDVSFRRARANWPAHYEWDKMNAELFLEAQRTGAREVQHSSGSKPVAGGVPTGYCRLFHTRGQSCNEGLRCRYKHACPKCQKQHQLYLCYAAKSHSAPKKVWAGPSGDRRGPGFGLGKK